MGELLWRDLEGAIELTADVLAGRITADRPPGDGDDAEADDGSGGPESSTVRDDGVPYVCPRTKDGQPTRD